MLNTVIIIGLAFCVIALLAILYKYMIAPNGPSEGNHGARSSDIPPKREKNLETDIDFFNEGKAIIAKKNKIVDPNNNKTYFLIDLGNGKIMVMEEDYYAPDRENELQAMAVMSGTDVPFGNEDVPAFESDRENSQDMQMVSGSQTDVSSPGDSAHYESDHENAKNMRADLEQEPTMGSALDNARVGDEDEDTAEMMRVMNRQSQEMQKGLFDSIDTPESESEESISEDGFNDDSTLVLGSDDEFEEDREDEY